MFQGEVRMLRSALQCHQARRFKHR